ncbi:MAG: 30S ribosomal protein S6--L-glutamate ligase, partial [Anaerolineales bacterium]|nr:30S ribosomal protein S6--L-glutamate ligase [Anaerolineales bacterium]
MRIGILFSRIRQEEKLIVQALEARGVNYELIDVREAVFDLERPSAWQQYNVILERCVSHSQAMAALQILGMWG